MQTVNPHDFESTQQSKMDEGLLVKFEIRPRQVGTNAAGIPEFRDVEYVNIRVPGAKDFICRPAQPKDIARFPMHYKAFQDRISQDDLIEGTLLDEWPLITRSQCEQLKFANVKTVEQLVSMPDSNADQFMGIRTLQAKAKQWLEQAADMKAKAELQGELAKRDEEIETLKAQMAELMKKPKVRKKRTSKKKTVKKE